MAKVMLLGTEMSDNLSLRYLAAPLIKANHSVKIVDFSSWDKKKNVVRLIKDFQPDLVGLSMVFNARGKEFCQLGGMTEMRDNNVPFGKSAYEIIRDAVSENDYPFCYNFPAGHIENNMAVVLGQYAEIEIEKSNCIFSQKLL